MTKVAIGSVFLAMLAFVGLSRAAGEVSLESVPPVVTRAVPEAGSEEVDASITEIKITFSKDMTDGSWSWSTLSEESFPETTGEARYEQDKRTCVLPVRLKSGTTYAIWVNSVKFAGFKDSAGQSAVPYLLVFKTKS